MGHQTGALVLVGLAASAFLLAGCMVGEGCVGAQGYTGQTGVCNETDAFSYGKNVGMESGTETFTWENTVGVATVYWGANASGGSVTVAIEDADGTEVYRETHASMGQKGTTESTDEGTPGEWTVRIQFTAYTGQMGLALKA